MTKYDEDALVNFNRQKPKQIVSYRDEYVPALYGKIRRHPVHGTYANPEHCRILESFDNGTTHIKIKKRTYVVQTDSTYIIPKKCINDSNEMKEFTRFVKVLWNM
jgi:hypothetical protein